MKIPVQFNTVDIRIMRDIAQQLNSVTEGRQSAMHGSLTAAPTSGSWAQGDFVRNSAPSGSLPTYGWLRTVEGTWIALPALGPVIGDLLSIGVSAPALTHTDGKDSFTVRYGNATPNSIYAAIFPGVDHFDAVNGVVQVAAGSTIEHATGIAGYAINNDASPTNAVGLFGCAIAAVDNAHVWGINTLLQDAPTRLAGTGTGRYLVNEFDFNVMNPATTVIGCSVGGNSLAQPTSANGFVCNVLGTGFKWTTAFNSQDAAATYAFNAGMTALSGASVPSQSLLFQYTTAASVKQSMAVNMDASGYLRFAGSVSPTGYSFVGADIFVDAGKGYRVGGNVVTSDRRTGYTNAMTGTANRATAYATGTVTLVQLAERVKALQDDLTTHGLIGT